MSFQICIYSFRDECFSKENFVIREREREDRKKDLSIFVIWEGFNFFFLAEITSDIIKTGRSFVDREYIYFVLHNVWEM